MVWVWMETEETCRSLEGRSDTGWHLWTPLHLTQEEAAIHLRLGENFVLLSSLSAAPRSGW